MKLWAISLPFHLILFFTCSKGHRQDVNLSVSVDTHCVEYTEETQQKRFHLEEAVTEKASLSYTLIEKLWTVLNNNLW